MSGMTAVGGADRSAALFDLMSRAMGDPAVDLAKMREIYQIYTGMQRDQARGAFLRAMAAVQAELEPVVRNAHNEHMGNYNATLDSIVEAARPIYTRHHFALYFRAADPVKVGNVRLICVTSFAPPELPVPYEEESPLESPPDMDGSKGNRNKTAIQGVVSATTHLRKVLTCLAFNIVIKYRPPDETAPARQRSAAPTEEEAASDLPDEFGGRKVWPWLEELDARLTNATTREAMEAVLTDARVQKISTWLADTPAQKSAYGRFRMICSGAEKRIERLRATQHAQPPPVDLFPDGAAAA